MNKVCVCLCLDRWRWKGNSNFLSLEGRKPSPVTNTHSSTVAPTYSLSWNRLLHMNTPTSQVPCVIFIFVSYRILCPEKIIDDLHDSHHHCSEYLCRWFLYLCNISSILLKNVSSPWRVCEIFWASLDHLCKQDAHV